jgi:membrane-associated phospholipid phosphatase
VTPRALGDTHDYQVVNDFMQRTSWLHPAATAYANYGVVLFAVLLVAAALMGRRSATREVLARAILAGAGALVAVAVNQPIVHAVAEPRPFTRVHDAIVLVHRSADASFPSDHATMAGAVAVGLLLAHRRLGLLACGLALLMAADRVYVGAHYPLDVLAGLALGAGVALLVQLLAGPLTSVLSKLGEGRLRRLLVVAA